jgi:guanine deaminase
MAHSTDTMAIRGRLLTFLHAPKGPEDSASYLYLKDGILLMQGGRITAIGRAEELKGRLPVGTTITHYERELIVPGFIDTHIHFPQTQVIASYGSQLMEWLETYTFVEELKYADPAHSNRQAAFFVEELLRNGTTTAAVYGSVHPESVEAFFTESQRRGTCMIAGKVMMDRNAPPGLTDTAESSYSESKVLTSHWLAKGEGDRENTCNMRPYKKVSRFCNMVADLRHFAF